MIGTALRGVALAALALGLAGGAARADKPIPADAKVEADPGVKRGTLPNGLRYAIMHNATPAGAVSVRLAMDVGSYLENEDELGYAHFIEHMAFRSTRQAPKGVLDNPFGALGVGFGRDQNAATTLMSTVYQVDLPRNDLASVQTVLDWMRGAADGILFTPEAVDQERGVVLSEIRTRANALTRAHTEVARFELPGIRSALREPGGTEESLKAATPEKLAAFHHRWYRPDNAVLVIVGDGDEAELLKAAEKSFGSWKAEGPAPARPQAPKAIPARSLAVTTVAEPTLPASVAACRVLPASDHAYSLESERRDLYSQIWTSILDARLKRAADKPESGMMGGMAMVSRALPDAADTCIVAIPLQGKWKEALADMQAEVRRFAKDGPTEQEVKATVTKLASQLGGSLYQADSRPTSSLAERIAASELDREPFVHPLEAVRLFGVLTEGITPADVKSAFARDWSGSGPILAGISPTPLAKAELAAAWNANETAAPLTAYADAGTSEWSYLSFGKAGKVAKKERVADGGYMRYRFRNGALLSFKHTSLKSGGVEIRVRFGDGERGLDNASRAPAELAAGAFPEGGLGRLDHDQISTALAGTTWSFKLDVTPTAYILSSSTLSEQAGTEMRVLAAYMTDPGFRPAMDAKLPTAIDFVYRMLHAEPAMVANEAMEKAVFPSQPSFPSKEEMATFKSARFADILKPALTGAPVEVTIVGDIAEKDAVKIAAETFGALPQRAGFAAPTGPGPFRRFPDSLPRETVGYHQGPAEKAAALVLWPLYTAVPERRSEEYALRLLSQVFETRLLQKVRGEMGMVYSPNVENPMPDFADQGYMAAQLETAPKDLSAVVAAARAIAAELVAGRITQEEIDRAREPLIAERRQLQAENSAWAGTISAAARHPEAMRELTGYEADMRALTLADVKKAAATWLAREPIVAKALPESLRPGATAAGSGAAAGSAQPSAH
jgi:zinc protease